MSHGISRRDVLRAGAAATIVGSSLAAPHVHAQGTGGRLALGLWDHWVGAVANDALRAIIMDWGQKNRVEITLDFITSVGNKNLITIAAEAQARSGHDVLSFPTWMIHDQQRLLEPMDDVMGRLTAKYGAVNDASAYLAKIEGRWLAVPQTTGSQFKGSAARVDLMKQHAGIDVQAMYPAENRLGDAAASWNWETFLTAADKCNKAGFPFALPAGTFTDATDWIGAMFAGYGANLVDANGNITIRNNDKVRQVMDYAKRLFQHIPNEMFAADDATNNRALISGRSALIFNPPSAWAVAKRDAPDVASQVWHFPSPMGPASHTVPHLPYFFGLWSFSRAKSQAKALLEHLSQIEQVQKMVDASVGYDIPAFASMFDDIATWRNVSPPAGVVYNYPVRAHHKAVPGIAYAPAPAEIAVQMYNQGIQAKMIARMVQNNEPLDRVLAWAEREVEGFKRG
ncbi:ABC transporter substrate-binding protein [Falsiroseomonas selenitidurans]|uniref:Carbohydrate ABC transporter substrate-binding protein n=1 Tax=Falsiroseomonas selenitidurans TaxID=2716335 RepID=A0ABX1E6X2_9PROT|nr:ABC transporter substrate-binding protein [Falsiroseomonas selenitidurans]NKC32533.1 carbohydrate ABC transporter substrate-binding protein [Falsiroseomonas selenitidurans]